MKRIGNENTATRFRATIVGSIAIAIAPANAGPIRVGMIGDSLTDEYVEEVYDWLRRGAWVYPAEIVSELGSYSISGGVFTPDGKLYCTGHDNAEVYVFTFPKQGSTLVHEDTIPMPMHGQGIALDPSDPNLLYGIDRPQRQTA